MRQFVKDGANDASLDSCLRRKNEVLRLLPLLSQGQAYFVLRNDTRTFIYKGFRPPSGMP
jgi:hypothetical protein